MTVVMQGFLAETRALLRRFAAVGGTIPNTARRRKIDTLIRGLKTAGIWTKRDLIIVPWAHEASAMLVNWKAPGTGDFTSHGTPTTFVADVGVTGNALDYCLQGPNLNTLPQYAQDSANVACRIGGLNAQEAPGCIGLNGNSGMFIVPRSASDQFSGRANSSSTPTADSNSDSRGHFAINRASSSEIVRYHDGVAGTARSSTSVAPPAAAITILKQSAAFSARTIQYFAIGASLSAQEIADETTLTAAFVA